MPLDQANKAIDNYIRYQIPELQFAKLVSVDSEGRSGENNFVYTYEIGSQKFSVGLWDNPATKLRQIRSLTKTNSRQNDAGQKVQ